MNIAEPSPADLSTMVRSILGQQMQDDPAATVVSSGIILPTIADHGFSHDHEVLVEEAAEDIWGRYLRGEIKDPVAAVQ